MPQVRVDSGGRRFLVDGRPAYLLADTLWAAFSRPTEREWHDYLQLRRRQGFNAVNISVLPIAHDRSAGPGDQAPFAVGADGSWDVSRLDDGYFERARRMTQTAVDLGFVPVLVVLWCTYVPGTWAAQLNPPLVLDWPQTERYVRHVAASFGDLDPVLCVSGDEKFTRAESTERYVAVARLLRQLAPGSLLTMHPAPDGVLPAGLADSGLLDYYSYQSGHDEGWDRFPYEQADRYAQLPVRRPVVSMEPCYEGHGYGQGARRHTAATVRQAMWGAVLAGAGAGLGYGAHGVWSWHRRGDQFNGEHFSGPPFSAQAALQFPGARDAGLVRRLVEARDLYDLEARQDLVVADPSGVRFGLQEASGRAAAWLPHPWPLRLRGDFGRWQLECWDLAAGRRDDARASVSDGVTLVEQPEFPGDALYLFSRPGHR
jgi:hypothetical protein